MKRTTALALCILMLFSTCLVACMGDGGESKKTTAQRTTEAPTTASTTTAATTAGNVVTGPIPTPEKLVAEFEVKNATLYNAYQNPVSVLIDGNTYIDLQMQGWPTICRGDGDTLYAVSSIRRGHVDPYGATAFYVSHDAGRTWEGPRIINDTPVDDRDTGIAYMGEGRLIVSFFTIGAESFRQGGGYADLWDYMANPQQNASKRKQWTKYTDEELKGGKWYLLSDDYGQTWTAPIKAPVTAPHGPTVANDGSLIFCGAGDGGYIYLYRSYDFGRTWELVTRLQTPSKGETGGVGFSFTEAYCIQLRDGKYVACIRAGVIGVANDSATLRVFISYSDDGENFTKAVPVPDVVGAPPHLLELSNGALLLTYSYRGGIEDDDVVGARGRVSYDGGKTWDEEIIISESFLGADLGYPSTVELDDGTLITTYYQPAHGDTGSSLLYTRWRLVEPED